MSVTASFDLLLRGGRVIDPAAGIDGIKDVAIRNGKIAAVQSDILPTSAKEVVDVTGKLVLAGLDRYPTRTSISTSAVVSACSPTWSACSPASPR